MSDQAIKQDNSKPRWSLILGPCRRALEAVIEVREYGNKKYADAGGESWRKVDPQRYLDAAARHLVAAQAGERVNHADGGVNHLAQAMVNLLFAYEIEAEQAEQDKLADDHKAIAEAAVPDPAPAVPDRLFLWRDDGSHMPIGLGCELPSIDEIFTILARIRRWNGHVELPLTVLAHSVLVMQLVQAETRDPAMLRAALLHDSAEALYGDRSTPVKLLEASMGEGKAYKQLVRDFEQRLEAREGLPRGALNHPTIKHADRVSVCIESLARGIPRAECERYYSASVYGDAIGWWVERGWLAVTVRNDYAPEYARKVYAAGADL